MVLLEQALPLQASWAYETATPLVATLDSGPRSSDDCHLGQSYGQVFRIHTDGHLSVPTDWTKGSTTFELTLTPSDMSIEQDGVCIGWKPFGKPDFVNWSHDWFSTVDWGGGIYGPANMKLEPF